MPTDYPRVSILMGIYNCAHTLREAVVSIQNQTYQDWELVMCDDGSSDGTYALALELAKQDTRLVLIKNSKNLGLAATLDKCAAHARGEFFGRMDGDDVSLPERLQKLVSTLDANPWASVVSSWMTCFDENGDWGVVKTPHLPGPKDHLLASPFIHAPSMMRRDAFLKVGGYGSSPWIDRVEDRNLWFKFAQAGLRGINIQESLYRMRDDRSAEKRRSFRSRLNGFIVAWRGIGGLGFPPWMRLYAFRPLLVWMVPDFIYRWLRRWRRRPANC